MKPTKKILSFERSLGEKAVRLRDRYNSDVRRAKAKSCGIQFKAASRRVSRAYSTIIKNAQTIFRQGIEVCKGSCVTISYANDVKALAPQFTILENEASLAAQKVQACYKNLGINKDPSGAPGETARTINSVRAGLNNLIRQCSKTNVCKPS